MNRRGALPVLALAAALAWALPAAAAPREPVEPPAGVAANPLEQARQSAFGLAFSGRVLVRWVDEEGLHGDALDVEASRGVLVVEGAEPLMARGGERLVGKGAGAWDLLWPAGLAREPVPPLAGKYRVARGAGPTIAGRPSTMVEVRRDRHVLERLFLDQATGLVLRREQRDRRGVVRRSVTFDELRIQVPPVPLTLAVSGERSPRRAAPERLDAPYQAPATLGQGYRRVGAYRRGDTLQVVYSDGMYALSVFQQAGRLDRRSVPAGGRVAEVAGTRGWSWSWAGGEILLWEAGGRVVTLVGDAPPPDVFDAARSLPAEPSPRPSLLARLRRACRALVQLGL